LTTIYVVTCRSSASRCYVAKSFTSEERPWEYAAASTTSSAYYRVEAVTVDGVVPPVPSTTLYGVICEQPTAFHFYVARAFVSQERARKCAARSTTSSSSYRVEAVTVDGDDRS
jgi:hypothetical protein